MKILDERDKKEILNNLEQITREFVFQGVTLADVTKDMYFTMISGGGIGISLEKTIVKSSLSGHCVFSKEIKKGDVFMATHAHTLTSTTPYFVVTNSENIVIDIVDFTNTQKYVFEKNGYFHICFDYTTVQAGEFFYLKTPSSYEPFVLYAEKAEEYLTDAIIGDRALSALMSGRQIYVRVPNADGNNYTAVYSPVLTYQLPNYMNDYLYLFYLRDEKQELSALGLAGVQLPIYGQLKVKLSKTYNQTPLI